MIKFTNSLAVANALLSVVNSNLDEEIDWSRFWVESYANGREQGYCICGSRNGETIGIAFAEHRNSDNIVVYVGEGYSAFSMQGNTPSQKVWEDSKFFLGH
jgi:hypothetical protein